MLQLEDSPHRGAVPCRLRLPCNCYYGCKAYYLAGLLVVREKCVSQRQLGSGCWRLVLKIWLMLAGVCHRVLYLPVTASVVSRLPNCQ